MAGNNTIGHGALIVSANIDKLGSGLAAAEGKINQFATKASKGGFLSGLFGKISGFFGKIGSLAGAAAKGAAGGIGAVLGGLFTAGAFGILLKLPEIIEKVKDKATGTDSGALAGITDAFQRLQDAGEKLIVKVLVALAPAFTRFADIALEALDRFGPTLDKILAGIETWAFVGVEVFGVIVEAVTEVIAQVVSWSNEIAGVADTTEGTGQAIMRWLRNIGKGFAYVWDTVKAGAGIIAWVAGKIIQALGWVIKKLGEVITLAADLADKLPAALRSRLGLDGLRPAAEFMKGLGSEVDAVGEKFEKWGERQVNAFGDSAKAVDKWFDGVEERLRQRKADLAKEVFEPLKETKLAGAMHRGGTEAYSVVAKFQAGNLMATDNAKAMLQAQREANRKLDKIDDALRTVTFGAF